MKHFFLCLLLGVLVAGCTADVPPIVLAPPEPLPAALAVAVPPVSRAAALVVRDSRALRRQADRYIGSKDSDPVAIKQLTTLEVQVMHAVDRMRKGRSRPADVIAARVAADALAAFLQTQAQ